MGDPGPVTGDIATRGSNPRLSTNNTRHFSPLLLHLTTGAKINLTDINTLFTAAHDVVIENNNVEQMSRLVVFISNSVNGE